MRRVRYSFQSLPWRRAMWELLTSRRPYDAAADTSFDDRHGTDTAGSVEPGRLGIDDRQRRDQAIRYLPSPPRVTTWMLDRAVADPSTYTFVDLGCGKGRVVLLAAQRPFQRVIGVDISAELAAVARRNVAVYRPPPPLIAAIDIVEADVTTVDLPETDVLLHLYHPFEPDVTAAVLRRLEPALPRRVTIAYLAYTAALAPVAAVLDEFEWLEFRRCEQSVRGHYSWLIYGTPERAR
jgi:SAM-dependent methyltransferase